jgi:small subunit ribosomal protein S17
LFENSVNAKWVQYYATPYNVLVSDPTDAAREGDVVSIQAGYRASKHVHHVIADIVAPMGPPLSQRPHLMTEAERIAALIAKREARDKQQAAKGRLVAVRRVKESREIEKVLSEQQSAKSKSLVAALESAKEKEAEEFEIKRREVIQAKFDEYQYTAAKLKALVEAQKGATETERKELEAQAEALIKARRAANAERQTALYYSKALTTVFGKTLKYWGKDYADPSFRHNEHPDTVAKSKVYSEMVRDRMEQYFQPSEAANDSPHLRRYPGLIKLQDEINEYAGKAKEAREQQKSYMHLYLKIAEARVLIAQEMISIVDTDFNQTLEQISQTTVDLRHMGDEDIPRAIKVAAEGERSRRKTKLEGLEAYMEAVKGKEVDYATNSTKWNSLVIEIGLSQRMKALAASELAHVPGVEQYGAHIKKWSIKAREAASAARRTASEAAPKKRSVGIGAETNATIDTVVEAASTPNLEATSQPASDEAGEAVNVDQQSAKKPNDEKKGLRGWLGL